MGSSVNLRKFNCYIETTVDGRLYMKYELKNEFDTDDALDTDSNSSITPNLFDQEIENNRQTLRRGVDSVMQQFITGLEGQCIKGGSIDSEFCIQDMEEADPFA